MRRLFVLAVVSMTAGQAHAAWTAVSPAHTLALAELYTSEGCDSCPPADRWMSGLAARGLGPDKVVPIGLHVDYWDYIGWKDVYAQPQFTERQRQLSRLAGSTFVYTPQVLLQGRDFRGWSSAAFEAQVKTVNARPAQADIRLALDPVGGALQVVAEASSNPAVSKVPSASTQLFVALTQSRISSPVKAGENRGTTLKHDYVVRQWFGPLPFGVDGKARMEQLVKPPGGAPTNDLGVVALVQDARTGAILQALKLDACKAG